MRALEAARVDGESEDRMGGIFGTEHQQRQFRRSLVGQGWSEHEVMYSSDPVFTPWHPAQPSLLLFSDEEPIALGQALHVQVWPPSVRFAVRCQRALTRLARLARTPDRSATLVAPGLLYPNYTVRVRFEGPRAQGRDGEQCVRLDLTPTSRIREEVVGTISPRISAGAAA
jgi:hypothetical protein